MRCHAFQGVPKIAYVCHPLDDHEATPDVEKPHISGVSCWKSQGSHAGPERLIFRARRPWLRRRLLALQGVGGKGQLAATGMALTQNCELLRKWVAAGVVVMVSIFFGIKAHGPY